MRKSSLGRRKPPLDPKQWPGRGLTGEQTIEFVRERWGPATLVSFSCGKASIAAYLAVREKFERAVCYYLYAVPGLEFVEETLDYFERYFTDEPIVRMPQPATYGQLGSLVFQPPEHVPVIEAAGLHLCVYNYADVQWMVKQDKGLPEHTMDASGTVANSPARHASLKHRGGITISKQRYYPIWDWNQRRIMETLKHHGVRLPVDYALFGRSFDGLDGRFLAPIKRHRPRDYQRILEYFPLAEAEIFRLEKFGGFTV